MEVKEAIELIKKEKYPINTWDEDSPKYHSIRNYNKKLDEVISLLQQGEAYRQMWEELKDRYESYSINESYRQYLSVGTVMTDLEQKYFLKEGTSDELKHQAKKK